MARRAERPTGEGSERGRESDRPSELPKKGWRDVLLRTKEEIGDDHVSIVAAGVAFYTLLAIFPAIAAAVSIWALLFDPQQIAAQIESVSHMLPQEAAEIINSQGQKVASNAGGAVSLAAIGGLVLTLYSASKGVKTLIEGLNIVYDEKERRGFLKLNLTALAITLFLIIGLIVSLATIAVLPALVGNLGLGSTLELLVTYLRWPILFIFVVLALTILYRYAPSRSTPRWRWVNWGAVIAALLWVIGSIAFSLYVRYFGSYNETYGSVGAVIILLMWLWLSALIVLLGAELNSEMEHQTGNDTTTGRPERMGRRGAHAADTLGQER